MKKDKKASKSKVVTRLLLIFSIFFALYLLLERILMAQQSPVVIHGMLSVSSDYSLETQPAEQQPKHKPVMFLLYSSSWNLKRRLAVRKTWLRMSDQVE